MKKIIKFYLFFFFLSSNLFAQTAIVNTGIVIKKNWTISADTSFPTKNDYGYPLRKGDAIKVVSGGKVRGINFVTGDVFFADRNGPRYGTFTDFLDVQQKDYDEYVALVTQSGTSSPSATVKKNELGVTLTWSRVSGTPNVYRITRSSGTWATANVVISIGNVKSSGGSFLTYLDDSTTGQAYLTIRPINSSGTNTDWDNTVPVPVSIRVYR